MLKVLVSRKASCTVPVGVVWMRSLCTICAPTISVMVPPPGGVLSEVGLTAVAVPTCCAAAGAMTERGAEENSNARPRLHGAPVRI